MGDNIDANATAAIAQDAPYVTLSSLYQILLEFLVLAFGVDVIGLSCLDMVCLSIMLVCMISLITGFIIMLCLPII
jgi:CobQ-like glutamine amidotransferase family enzyme